MTPSDRASAVSIGRVGKTMAGDGERTKDNWDKIEIIGKFLGATLIAAGLGLAGHFVSLSLGGREIDIKMMTIATKILELEQARTGDDARLWAKRVLEKLSHVPMGNEVLKRPIGIVQDFTEKNKNRIDVTVFSCDQNNVAAAQRI